MELVNIHSHTSTPDDEFIGRPSVFGNPFPFNSWKAREYVSEYLTGLVPVDATERAAIDASLEGNDWMRAGRLICLSKYRRYVLTEIRKPGSALRAAILALKPTSILMCYCDPLPCHGLIIIRAWEWLQREGA